MHIQVEISGAYCIAGGAADGSVQRPLNRE